MTFEDKAVPEHEDTALNAGGSFSPQAVDPDYFHRQTDPELVEQFASILDARFKLFRDPKTGEERVYSLTNSEATLVRNPKLLETELYKGIKQLFSPPPPVDVVRRAVTLWNFNTQTIEQDPQPFTFEGDERLSFKRFKWKPQEGAFAAWEEFLMRLSDRDAFMAWIWSVFEERNVGRQYLWLHGENGEDGKSVVGRLLAETFGNAATGITGGNLRELRFFYASIWGKRLVLYADCKNAKLGMHEVVRAMTSGDPVQVEVKNGPTFSAVLHSKLLVMSNYAPDITSGNADLSRCVYITVSESKTKDDPTWESRLRAELPAFLHACREVYSDRCPHHGKVQLSEATTQGVLAAADEFEADFDDLFHQNWATAPADVAVQAHEVRSALRLAGFKDSLQQRDFKNWIIRKYGVVRRKSADGWFYFGMKKRQ
jgi:hypothetical protein